MPTPAQPDALIRWMGSLGDPARLRTLRLLEQHELGVAELSDILQLPQSTISRHLKMLNDEGWLRGRRVGTTHLSTIRGEADLDTIQARLWHLAREQIAGWASVRQDELRLQRRLRDRQDDTRRFFTGAAAEWDEMREDLYGSEFGWQAMVSLLPADSVVADLGCGTGQLLHAVAPNVKLAIGVDNTPAMLEAAASRLRAFKNVELLQGELEALPIDAKHVDAVTMVLALSYVADAPRCVREIARILKPGGRVAIVDVTAHDRDDFRAQMGQRRLGFDAGSITQILADAGLRDAKVRDLPPAANVKGPALFLATARRP